MIMYTLQKPVVEEFEDKEQKWQRVQDQKGGCRRERDHMPVCNLTVIGP